LNRGAILPSWNGILAIVETPRDNARYSSQFAEYLAMAPLSDSATSLTLLAALCGPETDEAAWRGFFDRYQPLICRWCARLRLQEADAEDVTQQVLKRVFAKIHSYDSARGSFRGWLKSVVHNAIKDFLRTRGRRPADHGSGDSNVAELLNAIAEPDSIDGLVRELDTSLRQDVEASLARVTNDVHPESMRAFRLIVLEGKSIADAAAQVGKSYAAVCMAVNRIKKKLRAEGARLGDRPRNSTKD
jgi:RNA polymerase sigma factor (sigma-70 family)